MTHVQARLRHLTRILDLRPPELERLLDLAEETLADPTRYLGILAGRSIACIFEQPAARTHVSFAAAIGRLGATPITLAPHELRLGHGESIADTARSLSSYVDAIVVETHAQATVTELARSATVPVVNAFSDTHHPCQALADLLTVRQAFGDLVQRRVAFCGDGSSNVAHSLLEAAALVGVDVTVACPRGYAPDPEILHLARAAAEDSGAELQVVRDPRVAVAGAHAVYTELWASVDGRFAQDGRREALAPYQVSEELMALAQPGAIFLHRLPAHRGEEADALVIDGPQTAIWQQSANRLPAEEAVLLLLSGRLG